MLLRLLDPVIRSLSREDAELLVALRVDDDLQVRLDELAGRNTEGTLTADERTEYEAYVNAGDALAVLQARAADRIKHANI